MPIVLGRIHSGRLWWLRTTAVTSLIAVVNMYGIESEAQTVSGQFPPPRQVVVDPTPRRPGNQGLTFHGSAFGALDNNDVIGVSPSGGSLGAASIWRRRGGRAGGDAALDYSYSRQWTRAAFGANGRAGVNLYSFSSRPLTRINGGVYESFPLSRRTTVTAHQAFSYAPYYNFGFFPELNAALDPAGLAAASDPDIDLAAFSSGVYRYSATANVNHQVTRRSSLTFGGDWRYTDFARGPGGMNEQQVRGRFSHRLTQALGVHAGYGYGRATFGSAGSRPETHNIDVGVDFGKTLSFSLRRTRVAFSVGSSLIADSGARPRITLDRRHFRVNGSASLAHDIGRSWAARLSYRRGWEFIDGLSRPFFIDTVTAGLGGSLGRRNTLGLSASYLTGTEAFGASNDDRHEALRGQATYRMALTDWCAWYAQYTYYRYDFGAVTLPTDFPSAITRNGGRVGMSVSVPLLR